MIGVGILGCDHRPCVAAKAWSSGRQVEINGRPPRRDQEGDEMNDNDHPVVSVSERSHVYMNGGWGPNAMRNHLADDHGLKGAPDFEKHNFGKLRDPWGKHVRAQIAMHVQLHGLVAPKKSTHLLSAVAPLVASAAYGKTAPGPPPLPPDLPPTAIP
jgi:hypothetical protein